jgi:hypothetical protein
MVAVATVSLFTGGAFAEAVLPLESAVGKMCVGNVANSRGGRGVVFIQPVRVGEKTLANLWVDGNGAGQVWTEPKYGTPFLGTFPIYPAENGEARITNNSKSTYDMKYVDDRLVGIVRNTYGDVMPMDIPCHASETKTPKS